MTIQITVFHPSIPGIGDRTVIEGVDVEFRMEDGGALKIMRSITGTPIVEAAFAPGQWFYVSRSESPIQQADETVEAPILEDGAMTAEEQIKAGINRFIDSTAAQLSRQPIPK